MEDPFGNLAPIIPAIIDIDPENFDTKVFATNKKKKTKEIYDPAKPKSRFFSDKRGSRFLEIKARRKTLRELRQEWEATIRPKDEIIEEKVEVKVSKKEKADFLEALHKNTDSLHQFFLKEILPVYTAIDPALRQTVESASHIVGDDADLYLSDDLLNMIDDAINLKVFHFICDKLFVDEKTKKLIQSRYFTPVERKPKK
mgnify:CR=1 FL=1